ncbi:hypothetical protein K492DRAFT_133527 [Lichtheimia hyalospora FSU 10163]|nr:hypothetical protein K492DRAFT_133527 [Lichtheimia hyalospora FSU 10163]
MDSLYTNMVRFPNLIHAISPPSLYLDQLRWRFSNPGRMHAGYVDMQYGAFVPRWKCQTFLTQLGKSGFGKDQIRLADTLFSLWTNQYPWILAGPIYGHEALNTTPPYATMSKGIRRLQRVLEADTSDAPKDYFEREEQVPRLDERDVRAACDNDRCLFTTNLDPIPAPTELIYNRHDITSIQHWEELYNELGNSNDLFDRNPYHFAVDNDRNTCWNTFHYPKANDYLGLIFTGGDQQPDQFTMCTTNQVDHPEKQFKISITSDGMEWVMNAMQG